MPIKSRIEKLERKMGIGAKVLFVQMWNYFEDGTISGIMLNNNFIQRGSEENIDALEKRALSSIEERAKILFVIRRFNVKNR